MANKHVFLNNPQSQKIGFKRTRGRKPSVKEEAPKESIIKQSKVNNLRDFYGNFTQAYNNRYDKRTIEFPGYIDLIEIRFLPIFDKGLKNKFYEKYGLLPVSYSGFNRTVIFEVTDLRLFKEFKAHIEYIISSNQDVTYSGEKYNLIALIHSFFFIDKRTETDEQKDIVVSTVQSNSIEISNIQKQRMKVFLSEEGLDFSVNTEEDLFYFKEISVKNISFLEDNFDIVQSITSSRALNVRPDMFGSLRIGYGFEVVIPENLPTVGIIDTGVNLITPFKNLIVDGGINITGQTDVDHSGHGTLVAGLAIFGTALPSSIETSYYARCKVLPLKVLHHNDDGIDFPQLLQAIRLANSENGVRIFNMSLAFTPKGYNETFSYYAFELDRLSHELGILIFISVGNFDANSLHELLTTDYHFDHAYPDFFYKVNSSSPVHSCKNTNISTPSESLNNVSVGALAGNVEDGDNSDITPSNLHPAYYSRKFHFDYTQSINATAPKSNPKNKHLNKPDLVFDGGDLQNEQSGIEVLASPGEYFKRTSGTSLSAPLVTSIAAEISGLYPDLNSQSIKALLINSASYYKSRELPAFQNKSVLLRKLIGYGQPSRSNALFSATNTITMIVEGQVANKEIILIPIHLPGYLKSAGNKLIFDITIAYSFYPDKGNHLGYLPLHMGFNLVRNVDISKFDGNASGYEIKSSFSWSEDHYGIENKLFSNTQNVQYKLQPKDLSSLSDEVAIAVRCLAKENIDEGLKNYLDKNQHGFSLVIRIAEELKNDTGHDLYNEMLTINNLEIIGEAQADLGLDLES